MRKDPANVSHLSAFSRELNRVIDESLPPVRKKRFTRPLGTRLEFLLLCLLLPNFAFVMAHIDLTIWAAIAAVVTMVGLLACHLEIHLRAISLWRPRDARH